MHGQKAKSALYRNNHDGTFTDVTDKAGVGYPCSAMGGAVADYNNDGWPDMLITCVEGLVFGDYDGDGFVDLMVSRYVEFDLKNLPEFGSGHNCRFRGIPVQCGPRGMKGLGNSLYHNNGDGTFTDVSKTGGMDGSRYYGLGVVWSDFNDDGRPDLFIADDSTPNYLYRNDGNGHFTDVSFMSGTAVSGDGGEMAGMGVATCDYNHTGRASIHVTNFEDQNNSLFRNDGSMSFTDVSFASSIGAATVPYLGWGTGCVDFDNDGWPDLFVVNGHVYPQVDRLEAGAKYRERKLVFLNQHDGTFRDVSNLTGAALAIPQPSRGAAFGDLDNDGRIDVVVENIDGKPMVLRNEGNDHNHWITLQLIGTRSNRAAIGAKVKVVAGTLVEVDEVHSGGSYLSQNDLRIHFGLGDSSHVDRVEIRWPGGKTEVVQNLAVDRFYVFRESAGIVSQTDVRSAAKNATATSLQNPGSESQTPGIQAHPQ